MCMGDLGRFTIANYRNTRPYRFLKAFAGDGLSRGVFGRSNAGKKVLCISADDFQPERVVPGIT